MGGFQGGSSSFPAKVLNESEASLRKDLEQEGTGSLWRFTGFTEVRALDWAKFFLLPAISSKSPSIGIFMHF